MIDEGFDLLSGGIVKGRSSAIIGGVGFHESGIELMLANQQAEPVAQAWLGGMAVVICSRSGGSVQARFGRYPRRPAEFLDRAETNAIGFSKRSIDGTGFGDAHFCAVHKRGGIGRICIPVAHKASKPR